MSKPYRKFIAGTIQFGPLQCADDVVMLRCGCMFNAQTGAKIHATDTMPYAMQKELRLCHPSTK